jgi:hypothetical protein
MPNSVSGDSYARCPECEPNNVGTGHQFPPEYHGGAFIFAAFEASFETSELGSHLFGNHFGADVEIVAIEYSVSKQIAGTDDATITVIDHLDQEMDTLTLEKSTEVGVSSYALLASNNIIPSGQAIKLTMAKDTAGGRAHIHVYARFVR